MSQQNLGRGRKAGWTLVCFFQSLQVASQDEMEAEIQLMLYTYIYSYFIFN